MNKRTMYLLCLFIYYLNGGILLAQSADLQPIAIIANGGLFGDDSENVNLATYNFFEETYTVFDTIRTQSVQDMIVDPLHQVAYVAAQDSIIKYSLTTYERLAATAFEEGASLHNLHLHEDYLLAGKWFGGSMDNFLQVFNASDLSLAFTIPEINATPKGIVVVNDTAYISQNQTTSSFTDTLGTIALVDLNAQSYVGTLTLDNEGADIGRLFTDGSKIYTLNASDNSVTTYDLATQTSITDPLSLSLSIFSYGSRAHFYEGKIYTIFSDGIGAYQVDLGETELIVPLDTAAMALSYFPMDELFFITQSDFATFTQGSVYSQLGAKITSVPVGFSPEVIATYYQQITDVTELSNTTRAIQLYPNPVHNKLHIELPNFTLTEGETAQIQLLDISGKVFVSQNFIQQTDISTATFPSGIYIAQITVGGEVIRRKVLKF